MPQAQKIRILLVDDNQYFLAAVRRLLILMPSVEVVAEAHDGLDALSKVGQLQPDLVLLDIAMPGFSGLEVARRVQSGTNPPRIVILSMHDSTAYRDAARDLGVIGFVGKIDFVTELLPIIRSLIANAPVTTDSVT